MKPTKLSLLMSLAVGLASAQAATLVVTVSGLADSRGEVGCAVFANEAGFPMETAKALRQMWAQAPATGKAECRFTDLPPGRYAVAVSHDLNGNRRLDTNVLGMPTEPWGVSNGAHPKLRAPRFDEAAFVVSEGDGVQALDMKVAP